MTARSPAPDRELIVRTSAGDTDALGELYARYATPLLGTATHLLGNPHDAEEVVQDLFVGLPEALGRYEEVGRFPAWLKTVCVRLCLMRMRAPRHRAEVPLDGADPPSNPWPDRASRRALLSAIRALPPALRTVFVLREVEGYSHAEIAALLGISRVNSEVRLFRANRKLRKLLEET